MRGKHGGWLLFGYLLFVVYGSLVPLEPRALTLDGALSMFGNIRLLDVGTQGRADWVANGVLYFPLGFLTANLLTRRSAARPTIFACLSAIVFGVAVALCVEFLQLYFPPRTVSLNDLFAESIGTLLGATFSLFGLSRFRTLLAVLFGDHERLNAVLLKAYLVLYFLLALFPFDFVVSWNELSAKIATGQIGLLLATASADSPLRVLVKLMAEIVATVPLGLFLASRLRSVSQGGLTRGFVAGATIGVMIECAQILLVSGVSQGLSVLTRGTGVALGLVAAKRLRSSDLQSLVHGFRRFSGVGAAVYLLALLAVNDWFSREWLGPAHALDVFDRLRFLPFYYHYYTTEQVALLSLIAVFAMYSPAGLLCWLSGFRASGAAVVATLLCLLVEGSKLFLRGLHPDPTNVMLAALAGWFGWVLCERVFVDRGRSTVADPIAAVPAASHAPPRAAAAYDGAGGRHPARREGSRLDAYSTPGTATLGLLAVAALSLAWFALSFPFHGVLLGAGLVAYVVLLWKRPAWSVFFIPLGLVLLDLAPWSGWYFLDEFDMLMLLGTAIVLARVPSAGFRTNIGDGLTTVVAVLIVASYAIAALRGLFPLHWPEGGAAAATLPYSPFNALRHAKGVLWAFVALALIHRLQYSGHDAMRQFMRGVLAGLVVVTGVVLWERAVFPGLFALADVYRVTGPFSQMHVGGSDLEAYLVLAIPLLVVEILAARNGSARLAGVILLLASSYCLVVTFSRAAYVACALGAIVAAAIVIFRAHRSNPEPRRQGLLGPPAVLGLTGLVVAVMILSSPFARERLAHSGQDVGVRVQHWQDALQMRDPDWMTTLFGMGLGSFPETHYWRSNEVRAAAFGLGEEKGNRFLKLGPGSPLYIEQFVSIGNDRPYRIDLRLRSAEADASVTASLCEKWLLTSGRCASVSFAAGEGNRWRHLSAVLPTDGLDDEHSALRPVKLSLHYSGGATVVDVDDIRMKGPAERPVLVNGDFSNGLDRWFFSVDNDLPWHTWSLPVGVLFEQGWLGILAYAGLLAGVLWQAVKGTSVPPAQYAGLLGAVLGLATLSSVNTIVDSPRALFLLLVIALLALECRSYSAKAVSVRGGRAVCSIDAPI